MTTMEAPSTAPPVAPAAAAAEPADGAAASLDERPKRSRRSRITSVVLMAVTAVVIVAVVILANQPGNSGNTASSEGLTSVTLPGAATGAAPEVGKPAPDFTATTAAGTAITLSKLKGHPVWLTFGASWCQPCRAEAPDIQAAYADFKAKGGEIVQVFLQEDASAVKDYADRVGLTYTKVPDPNAAVADEYHILGIPSHFFIGADGNLQAMKVGSLDPEKIKAALAEIGG
jgi:peroxiredoxin